MQLLFFSPTDIIETALLMAVGYLVVLVAAIIDTVTGVRKARRLGIVIKSSILRHVFPKLIFYYGLIIMFSLLDVLFLISDIENHFGLKELPYMTFIGCIVAVATEAWSVWENMPRNDKASIEASLRKSKDLLNQVTALVAELRRLNPDQFK